MKTMLGASAHSDAMLKSPRVSTRRRRRMGNKKGVYQR